MGRTFNEDELVPISALQHLEFCPRQCAMIHVDRIWSENRLTAEGRILHDRAHERTAESSNRRIVARGLRICSLEHGLTGMADVVEFRRTSLGDSTSVTLPGRRGRWVPRPVEYKRGRPKKGMCDELQLCAQAFCLEEMLGASIDSGDLFYGRTRRRHVVRLHEDLRRATRQAILELHRLLSSGQLPEAVPGRKCERCSLRDECLAGVVNQRRSARRYVVEVLWPTSPPGHTVGAARQDRRNRE